MRYNFEESAVLGSVPEEEVRHVRRWASGERTVPDITPVQAALFLMACGGDRSATQRCILAYYAAKANGPRLFDDRRVHDEHVRHQLRMLQFAIMPARTTDNSCVMLHRLNDPTASNYHMETAMKLLFMTLDACLYDSPPDSLTILFDMRYVGLMHLSRIKLGAVRVFFQYLQEALPIRLKEIHVLNVVWFFDKIMAIVKPFMNQELKNKLHLHTTAIDMEDFYENCLPKSVLPSDFGGDLPSIEELHERNIAKLEEMTEHFEMEEMQRKKFVNN